jgi:hypothetical protein
VLRDSSGEVFQIRSGFSEVLMNPLVIHIPVEMNESIPEAGHGS